MEEKTCCITGHREISTQQLPDVERWIRQAVFQAIAQGYTRFLSGFAEGADLIFAGVVAEEKIRNTALHLEAAIPYSGRCRTKNPTFHRLLQACDRVYVACEQYVPSCFMQRNRYMVEQSQLVIAVYDGRTHGGTFRTIRYARKLGREVRLIRVSQSDGGDVSIL